MHFPVVKLYSLLIMHRITAVLPLTPSSFQKSIKIQVALNLLCAMALYIQSNYHSPWYFLKIMLFPDSEAKRKVLSRFYESGIFGVLDEVMVSLFFYNVQHLMVGMDVTPNYQVVAVQDLFWQQNAIFSSKKVNYRRNWNRTVN